MKPYQIIILLLLSSPLGATESRVKGDINCDGKNDIAEITKINNKLKIVVTLNNGKKTNELVFDNANSIHGECLVEKDAHLRIEKLEKDLTKPLGGNPEGYKPSSMCVGLNISGGDCAPIHIYWNHKKNRINWWRE